MDGEKNKQQVEKYREYLKYCDWSMCSNSSQAAGLYTLYPLVRVIKMTESKLDMAAKWRSMLTKVAEVAQIHY